MSVIHDPVGAQRYRFDDRGLEIWVDPGGAVPFHIHPAMSERFDVLEGQVTFYADGARQVLGPGGTIEVPAGAKHRFANESGAEAHMRAEPAELEELRAFLQTTAGLGRAGRIAPGGKPRGLRGVFEGALLAWYFRDSTRLTGALGVLQSLSGPIALLGRLFGYSKEKLVQRAAAVP